MYLIIIIIITFTVLLVCRSEFIRARIDRWFRKDNIIAAKDKKYNQTGVYYKAQKERTTVRHNRNRRLIWRTRQITWRTLGVEITRKMITFSQEFVRCSDGT